MLKYFYITNRPEVAAIADSAGVDRVFVDLEHIGKEKRQPMDTVKNYHTVDDIYRVRKAVKNAELLVRLNPLYSKTDYEVGQAIDAGADVIMLPMWNSAEEVEKVLKYINGKAELLPLLETASAADSLDDVLKFDEITEIHIGLNDLSISQHKPFLFLPLVDGTVDLLAQKIKAAGKTFGVGGVGAVGNKIALPAENILAEHYRLDSQMVILSRAFCNAADYDDFSQFEKEFMLRIAANRSYEAELSQKSAEFFETKHKETTEIVHRIVK